VLGELNSYLQEMNDICCTPTILAKDR